MQGMNKPAVGRIVHYFPQFHEFAGNESSPLPAVIVRVWGDNCVNLKILTDGPQDIWKTSVMQGDSPLMWNWPVLNQS